VVPLSVRLLQPGTNTLAMSASPTTSSNGAFSVDGIPAGTYDIEVKHSQSLSRRVSGVTFTAGVATSRSFGTLLTGDINNDNAITLPDFSLLSASFGRAQGQAGYDSRADLNGDNLVTLPDFSLLSSNFGTAGPVAAGGAAGN